MVSAMQIEQMKTLLRTKAIANFHAREAFYEAPPSIVCKRCGQQMPDADCAEGCEDYHCPLVGGCK